EANLLHFNCRFAERIMNGRTERHYLTIGVAVIAKGRCLAAVLPLQNQRRARGHVEYDRGVTLRCEPDDVCFFAGDLRFPLNLRLPVETAHIENSMDRRVTACLL